MIKNNLSYLTSGCTRTELGLAYAPADTPDSARRLLKRWINYHPTLLRDLQATGYDPRMCRRLTPLQVKIIFDALGTPS